MLNRSNASSDLIARIQKRTLYANSLIQQQKVLNGCQQRVQLVTGGDAAASLFTDLREGAVFTTATEQTNLLAGSYCPVVAGSGPTTIPLPTIANFTWVEQSSAPSQLYRGLTVTGDFATQIATRNTSTDGAEGPYISTDSGATWTRRVTGMTLAVGAFTYDVTVARSNANIMYTANRRDFAGTVASTYDDIYKSTDGGANWAVVSPAQATWSSITCSANGQVVLAGNTNGGGGYDLALAISTNGGSSWTNAGVSGQWLILAMNSTGTRMYAAGVGSTRIYYSTNYGVSWSNTDVIDTPRSLACSSDGLVVLVGTASAKPRLSTNGGVTFSVVSALPTETWDAICVSEDGNTLAAASSSTSYIWVSKNQGLNWTEQTTSPNTDWTSMDINSAATKIAAGPSSGKVNIGTYVP